MWPDDDSDLPVEVEAAFGADITADPGTWAWTDLSGRLLDEPVTMRFGRSPGASVVSPSTATVTLDNTDAALTPLHPLSPWWPNVDLGVPFRFRLRRAEDTFGRTVSNGWGTSDTGGAWTVVDGPTAAFSVSGGTGRHSHGVANELRATVLPPSLLDCEQLVTVSTSALLTGGALVTGVLARYIDGNNYYWLRTEFDQGSTDVVLKISKMVASVWTDLVFLDPVPSLSYAVGTPLRMRAAVAGTRLSIKVWAASGTEPTGWMLETDDGDLTAPGRVGTQSWVVFGNTNTLPVTASFDDYAVRVDRLTGGADQWEQTVTPGVNGESVSTVQITASGILRRLQQGNPPEYTPLRRTIAGNNPAAYYPLEDGIVAGQAGSAIAGHPPMTVGGTVEFKAVEDFVFNNSVEVRYGTSALADLRSGGKLAVTLPTTVAAATAHQWTTHVFAGVDYHTLSGDLILLQWDTPGSTYLTWQLILGTNGHTGVYARNAAGVQFNMVDVASSVIGVNTYAVTAKETAGTIDVTLYSGGFVAGTIVGVIGTTGGVQSLAINPTGVTATAQTPVGHATVWAGATVPYRTDGEAFDSYGQVVTFALGSWQNEISTERLRRIAEEAGVSVVVPPPDVATMTRMGWQPAGTLLDLIGECADVDDGILYERGTGLGYLPRSARYNPPVALTVDLATYQVDESGLDQVMAPAYDDRDITNEWTVKRVDGSEATYRDVANQRRGAYIGKATLNLASDDTLMDRAAWLTRQTTVVEMRESGAIPVDLAGNPDLIDDWLLCGVGSRVQRLNPPIQVSPLTDRLIDGWTETLGRQTWLVQLATSAASPWLVAEADAEPRIPGDGSTLGALLPAPGPARINDTMARAVSNGWGAANIGGAWTTVGATAADYSVGSGSGRHSNTAVNTPHRTIIGAGFTDGHVLATVKLGALTAGASVTAAVIARYLDTSNEYVAEVVFNTNQTMDIQIVRRLPAGFTVLKTALNVATHVAANTYRVRFHLSGSTLQARVWNAASTEPTSWQVTATDTSLTSGQVGCRSARSTGNTNSPATAEFLAFEVQDGLTASLTFTAANGPWSTDPADYPVDVRIGGEHAIASSVTGNTSPQVMNLSNRGGITREWPAGTEVDVWVPAVVPL